MPIHWGIFFNKLLSSKKNRFGSFFEPSLFCAIIIGIVGNMVFLLSLFDKSGMASL